MPVVCCHGGQRPDHRRHAAQGLRRKLALDSVLDRSGLARLIVAFLFIPAFYKYRCTSIYEFLGHRFGPATQYTGSLYFLVTRLLASGVRLYVTCMAVGKIMDWPLASTIALFTVVSILFIAFGGIKAVVWAGAYEALFFVVAGVLVVGYLLHNIDGGMATTLQTAGTAGRLSTFHWKLDLNDASTFWAGMAGGFFSGLVSFGADQEMVQRLLTVGTRRSSQKTIVATILAVLPVYWLYLLIGTLLYVFYTRTSRAPAAAGSQGDLSPFRPDDPAGGPQRPCPRRRRHGEYRFAAQLADFLLGRGDLYRPLLRQGASEKHYLRVSRIAVVGFGLLLAAIAVACSPVGNILDFAFQVLALPGGGAAGRLSPGPALTRHKANLANLPAMLVSTITCTVCRIDLATTTGPRLDLADRDRHGAHDGARYLFAVAARRLVQCQKA